MEGNDDLPLKDTCENTFKAETLASNVNYSNALPLSGGKSFKAIKYCKLTVNTHMNDSREMWRESV